MVDLDWLTNFLEHFVYATDKTSYGRKRSKIPGHEIPCQDKWMKLSADINYPQFINSILDFEYGASCTKGPISFKS